MDGRMAKMGRKPGFRMSDEHRVKIQNSNILNALIEHVEGRRDMSPTQVSAGLGLMKKVLPDLSNVVLEGAGENGEHLHRIDSDAAFSHIAGILGRAAAIKSGSADSEGKLD